MTEGHGPDPTAVVLRGSRILFIGSAEAALKRFPRHRTLDLGSAVLLPGLVNAHTHLELPRLISTARASDYASWVLDLLRAKARLVPADYQNAAESNVRELLRTGTTTVGEICTHRASPAVIARQRIRAVIFHEIISMHPDEAPAIPRRLISSGLIMQGLSPHSAHTVSPSALAVIRDVSRKRGLRVCMHVAECLDEQRLLRRRSGGLDRLYASAGWDRAWAPAARSSIEYLSRMKVLSLRFLAVHAVHIDRTDIRLLKRSGAAVAHCCRSNHAMRSGTMPLRRLLDAGIPVGLGTDSLASVPTLSLWDEMRFALRTHQGRGIGPGEILSMATRGGAAALGLQNDIGVLAPGMRADLIAVPMPRRRTGDIFSDLLRETESCIMTIVNGKVLHHAERRSRRSAPVSSRSDR